MFWFNAKKIKLFLKIDQAIIIGMTVIDFINQIIATVDMC